MTLNDQRKPVNVCPKCDRELGAIEVPSSMTFGNTPIPANVPVLQGANMVPVFPTAPANPSLVGQVAVGQTIALAPSAAPPGASDYVSGMRNRLAWLEGQVLLASSYKKEISILKRMLAPLKRPRRSRVVKLKVAK